MSSKARIWITGTGEWQNVPNVSELQALHQRSDTCYPTYTDEALKAAARFARLIIDAVKTHHPVGSNCLKSELQAQEVLNLMQRNSKWPAESFTLQCAHNPACQTKKSYCDGPLCLFWVKCEPFWVTSAEDNC
jgi:hypothetical protein